MDRNPTDAHHERDVDVVDVDVVVVTYHSASTIDDLLTSLVRSVRIASVTVVDNGSTDETGAIVARHAGVRWLSTGANLGFGAGANRGAAGGTGRYVCVLNPDLVVGPGAIDRLAEHLDAVSTDAIAAPLVANLDGTLYPSARRFPNLVDAIGHAFVGLVRPDNRWTRRYKSVDGNRPDWVSGTTMLIRRSSFEAVGGFDERYFMYVEDLDLCWRIRKAGFGVALVGEAVVTHEQGVSSRRHPYRSIADHHRSAWRFVRTSTTGSSRVLLPLHAGGLAARFGLAVVAARVSKPHDAITTR